MSVDADPPSGTPSDPRSDPRSGSHGSPPPDAGWTATQILVVSDAVRARDWWVDVLGAQVLREYGGTSVVLRFAGMWLLLVTGGEPTPDKPDVTLAAPADRSTVDHALTIRVPDCRAAYEQVVARGGQFLTEPYDWGMEIRCFLRDPDGHLVELSQAVDTE